MGDVINYKRWVITQRIKELVKALKRVEPHTEYYRARKEELDNLKRDLKGCGNP